MAEPLEWMAIAEGAYLAGEGVVALGEMAGLIGAATETAAVTTTVAEVAAGSTLVAETVGGGQPSLQVWMPSVEQHLEHHQ